MRMASEQTGTLAGEYKAKGMQRRHCLRTEGRGRMLCFMSAAFPEKNMQSIKKVRSGNVMRERKTQGGDQGDDVTKSNRSSERVKQSKAAE